MLPLFAAALIISLLGFLTLLRGVHARMRTARSVSGRRAASAIRYRPMLRLLNEEGVGSGPVRAFRARRRAIFRKYLRCLVQDYGQLLAGIRLAMVASGVDRPELARALAKNRFLFMLAICRIEFALVAHAAGFNAPGIPDLSGLIAGVDVLRGQLNVFQPGLVPAR